MERIRPFSTHEAARLCHVTPMTVIRWIEAGKIRAYKTAGGHRRIEPADMAAFCRSQGIAYSGGDTVPTPRALPDLRLDFHLAGHGYEFHVYADVAMDNRQLTEIAHGARDFASTHDKNVLRDALLGEVKLAVDNWRKGR